MNIKKYNEIIEVLTSFNDVRIIDVFTDELKIKDVSEVHFEFIALNNSKLKSNDNKRFTVKANTIVVNQVVAEMLTDESIVINRLYTTSSKNYANIVINKDLKELLQLVRDAHYEYLANKLELATEIEFKTTAKKVRKTAKKAQ